MASRRPPRQAGPHPLSLEEVTDLLAGREVLAHLREKREVLNYVEVLDYMDWQRRARWKRGDQGAGASGRRHKKSITRSVRQSRHLL